MRVLVYLDENSLSEADKVEHNFEDYKWSGRMVWMAKLEKKTAMHLLHMRMVEKSNFTIINDNKWLFRARLQRRHNVCGLFYGGNKTIQDFLD